MKRTLMAVVAHPDDESFGLGGTLARYSAEGADVHVVVATDGAAGSVSDEWHGEHDRLVEVREQELETAATILGIKLHPLNYRDSGYIGDPANHHPAAFVNAAADDAVGRLVEIIRLVRPQVIVTHDETGTYYHPDHIHCHQITTTAFHAAGDTDKYPGAGHEPYSPQRLYYAVFPRSLARLMIWRMRLKGQDPSRSGRNSDVDLTRLGVPNDQITAEVDYRNYWQVKMEAGAAHASQGGGTSQMRSFPTWLAKALFGREYFVRAYPPPVDGPRERDLFEGVVLDP